MAKNIIIYKAPIYRVFASDVNLVKGNIVPSIQSEVALENEEFYDFYKSFISFKYNCILADYDEACDFLNYSISKNNDKIVDLLKEANKKDFEKFLKAVSSCLYFNSNEMMEDRVVDKIQFKKMKESYKDKKKN